MQILDSYFKSVPSQQNALNIFQGEWASRFPKELAHLKAGPHPLFEDMRIHWGIDLLGGVANKTVLELGPLEAGHTYMLEKMGAASITSIEANTRSYLKCLLVKEVTGLQRARFLCGDFVEYLRTSPTHFDVCFASGVLYHMTNPVELLTLIGKAADQVFIWTHYYDQTIIENNPHNIAPKFTGSISTEYDSFPHTLYRYEYLTALDFAGFCGGSNTYSYWMSREEILACLKYIGLTNIEINCEQLDHPNGPCFALVAMRPTVSSKSSSKLLSKLSLARNGFSKILSKLIDLQYKHGNYLLQKRVSRTQTAARI